jgi:hypothetical protein
LAAALVLLMTWLQASLPSLTSSLNTSITFIKAANVPFLPY